MKTWTNIAALVLGLGFLVCISGCPVEGYDPQVALYGLTAAPPTKTATLDNSMEQLRTIDLSLGVAMAVRCYSYCEEAPSYDACADVTVVSDHPTVVRVDPVYNLGGSTDRFVLSGVGAGTTNVVITTDCGTRQYLTTVSP